MSTRIVASVLALCVAESSALAQVGFLTLPFGDDDVVITSGWLYDDGSRHRAIDYTLPPAQPFEVKAAASGKAIAFFDEFGGFGESVIQVHENENSSSCGLRFSLYAHLETGTQTAPVKSLTEVLRDISRRSFSDWMEVSRGQRLAQAGKTGRARGRVHLHYESHCGGYVQNKADPYDIRSTSVDYPEPCGPNHLWTECPPMPVRDLAQQDKSVLTATQMPTGKWAVQTLGSCHSGVLSGITVNLKFSNPVNGLIKLTLCETTSAAASELCGIFDVDLVQTREMFLRQEHGQILPNTQTDYFFDFDLAASGGSSVPGSLTLRPDRWYAFGISCLGQEGTCQLGGAPDADAYPQGKLVVDIDPGSGVGKSDALVKDAYFLTVLAPGEESEPCGSTLILKTDQPNNPGAGGITIGQAPHASYVVQSAVGELLTADRIFDRDYELHDVRLWLGMFENPICAETLVRLKEGEQVIASSAAATVCNFGTINNATVFPFPDGTVVQAGRTYQFVVETTSGSGLLRASSSLYPPSSSVYFEVFGAPVF